MHVAAPGLNRSDFVPVSRGRKRLARIGNTLPRQGRRFQAWIDAHRHPKGLKALDVVVEVKLGRFREAREVQDVVFVHFAERNMWW